MNSEIKTVSMEEGNGYQVIHNIYIQFLKRYD